MPRCRTSYAPPKWALRYCAWRRTTRRRMRWRIISHCFASAIRWCAPICWRRIALENSPRPGADQGLGAVAHIEFAQDVFHVGLGGVERDVQGVGDFLVGFALGQQ